MIWNENKKRQDQTFRNKSHVEFSEILQKFMKFMIFVSRFIHHLLFFQKISLTMKIKKSSEKKNLLDLHSSASENEEEDVNLKINPQSTDSYRKLIQLYPQRWLMLAIFSLNTFLNGVMLMGLSPVVAIVSPYYGVSSVDIQWLSNIFLLVYFVLSLPFAYAISKCGVRPILSLAAGLDALGTLVQYFGSKKDAYSYVVAGQLLASIVSAIVLIIPGKLSATWFPPNERGLSTSIGVFMNIFGMAIGFVQSSSMAPALDVDDEIGKVLKRLFASRFIAALFTLIITQIFYRENPPTPASYVNKQEQEKVNFLMSLKLLLADYNFHLMANGYAVYTGLIMAVNVVLPEFVVWIYGTETRIQHLIGWMGFTCDISGIVGSLCVGFFVDRYGRHKTVAVIINSGCFITWLAFSTVLTRTKNMDLLFVTLVIYGAMSIAYISCGIEQAAEMTFPVSVNVSSAVILLLSNLYGFIFVYLFGLLIEYGYPWTTLHLILGLYAISTILVSFSKMELKRTEAEMKSKQKL